ARSYGTAFPHASRPPGAAPTTRGGRPGVRARVPVRARRDLVRARLLRRISPRQSGPRAVRRPDLRARTPIRAVSSRGRGDTGRRVHLVARLLHHAGTRAPVQLPPQRARSVRRPVRHPRLRGPDGEPRRAKASRRDRDARGTRVRRDRVRTGARATSSPLSCVDQGCWCWCSSTTCSSSTTSLPDSWTFVVPSGPTFTLVVLSMGSSRRTVRFSTTSFSSTTGLLRLLTGRVQNGCQLEHAAQGEREQRRRRDHRQDSRTYEGEAETEPRGGPPDRQSAGDGMGGGGDRDEPRRAEDP